MPFPIVQTRKYCLMSLVLHPITKVFYLPVLPEALLDPEPGWEGGHDAGDPPARVHTLAPSQTRPKTNTWNKIQN